MKRLLLPAALFLFAGMANAQQRTVLVEAFSQASCGPCAAQNPALNTLLAANTAKVVSVKYQTSWPGYDPMNLQNASEVATRVNYYGINGVPDRIQDGTNMDITQSGIDTRYAVASPVSMDISHTLASDFATADVTVTITAPAVWNPSNTVLHLALVEKEIHFATAPGTNGETVFHSVMRKMYPGTAGTAVVAANFASAGGSQTFTFNDIAVPSYIYDLTEVAFVAWVQNTTTKEVYQAGLSEPQVLNNFGVVSGLNIPNRFTCATDLSGVTATLANDGANTITSATVNYQVDNGTAATAPFSGSIAVGGTTTFNIPTMTTASGSHTLKVWMTNINGSGSTTPIGLYQTTFATISAAGTSGAYSEEFTASTLPANWFLQSATNTDWARVTTNSGSMRFAAYAYANGTSGEMIMPPVNVSSLTNAALKFDVAYAQYQAENDKLEVFVSTDCGATWTSVYNKAGDNLETAAATTASFVPTAAQWRTETVSLASYASATKLFVKFKGTSNYGNNMYVDKINVNGVSGIEELSLESMVVYPNPATSKVNVDFVGTGVDYEVSLVDLTGRKLNTVNLNSASGAQTVEFSVDGLAAGNYMISVKSGDAVTTQRLAVQ